MDPVAPLKALPGIPLAQGFSTRGDFVAPHQDIGQCLETFLAVAAWGEAWSGQRGQGCWHGTRSETAPRPRLVQPQRSTAPRLRNPEHSSDLFANTSGRTLVYTECCLQTRSI